MYNCALSFTPLLTSIIASVPIRLRYSKRIKSAVGETWKTPKPIARDLLTSILFNYAEHSVCIIILLAFGHNIEKERCIHIHKIVHFCDYSSPHIPKIVAPNQNRSISTCDVCQVGSAKTSNCKWYENSSKLIAIRCDITYHLTRRLVFASTDRTFTAHKEICRI